MGLFSAIPVRENGQDAIAGWWNLLRTAGIFLENLVGAGAVAPTSFAIADNQSAAADITGLLFAGATYRKVIIDWYCFRATDSENKAGGGTLEMVYNPTAATWDYAELPGSGEAGLTLSCTAAGQVQYVSDDMTGTYDTANSKIKYTARTIDA